MDLDNDKVVAKKHQKGKHSYIDAGYMKQVESACLANREVQEQIGKLDLPSGSTVVVEAWAYATDGMNDMTQRVTMVGYTAPFNCETMKLIQILSAGSTLGCCKTRTQTTMRILLIYAQRSQNNWWLPKCIACPHVQMNVFIRTIDLLTAARSILQP